MVSYPPHAPGAMPPQWAPPHPSDANRPLVIALIVIGCLLLLAIGGCMVIGFRRAREAQTATKSLTKTMVRRADPRVRIYCNPCFWTGAGVASDDEVHAALHRWYRDFVDVSVPLYLLLLDRPRCFRLFDAPRFVRASHTVSTQSAKSEAADQAVRGRPAGLPGLLPAVAAPCSRPTCGSRADHGGPSCRSRHGGPARPGSAGGHALS